jgi:hypothetical protein
MWKVNNSASHWFKYSNHNKNILITIAGDVPGMLDYMIWPWMERFPSYKIVAPEKFVIPKDQLKKLVNYFLISYKMYQVP